MYLELHGKLQWWNAALQANHNTVLQQLTTKGKELRREACKQNAHTAQLTSTCKAQIAAQCTVQQTWLRAIYNDVKKEAELLQTNSKQVLDQATAGTEKAAKALRIAVKTNEQIDERISDMENEVVRLAGKTLSNERIDERISDMENEVVRLGGEVGALRLAPNSHMIPSQGSSIDQAFRRGRSSTPSGARLLQRSLSRDGNVPLMVAAAQGVAARTHTPFKGSALEHEEEGEHPDSTGPGFLNDRTR